MKLNIKLNTLLIALAAMTFVTSCKKDKDDDIAAPLISGLEVGPSNSLSAVIGSDLHMAADVVAEGIIQRIEVDIHKEDGTGEDVEAVFTNYTGQKNAYFHEHIDIPSTAAEGEYHFHLKVVDKEGQAAEIERDIVITAASSSAPVISDLEIGENDNHTAIIGEELHIEAHIYAPALIDIIQIEMHNEDGSGDDIEVTYTGYSGEDHADFHDHIEIPPTATPGEYHFHLLVIDQNGIETELDAEVWIEE